MNHSRVSSIVIIKLVSAIVSLLVYDIAIVVPYWPKIVQLKEEFVKCLQMMAQSS